MKPSSKLYLKRLAIDLAVFVLALIVVYSTTDDAIIAALVAALLAGGADLVQRRGFKV